MSFEKIISRPTQYWTRFIYIFIITYSIMIIKLYIKNVHLKPRQIVLKKIVNI